MIGALSVIAASNAAIYDPIVNETNAVWHFSARRSTVVTSEAAIASGSALDASDWTKNQVTVTANTPSGTIDRLTVDAAATSAYITQNVSNAATLSAAQVPMLVSFWRSYESIPYQVLETRVGTAANQVFFNVQTGAVGTVGASMASATIVAETRSGVAGYRCTALMMANAGTAVVRIYMSTIDATVTVPLATTSVLCDDASVVQVGVSSITNRVSGVAATQSTRAVQPEWLPTGYNGHACMKGYGAQRLNTTEAAIVNALKDSNANTIFNVIQITNLDAATAIVGVGNSTVPSNRTKYWGQSTSGVGKWLCNTINDAATTISLGGATTDLNKNVSEWHTPGTTNNHQINGGTADPSAGAQNPGTLTPDQFGMMARPDSVPDTFYAGLLADSIGFSTDKDSTQRSRVRVFLGTDYGVTVTP